MSVSSPTTPGFTRSTTQSSTLAGQISLTDNTKPLPEEEILGDDNGDDNGDDGSGILSKTSTKTSTSQRIGPARLRQQIARRKYAKYQQGRYIDEDEDPDSPTSDQQSSPTTPAAESAPSRPTPASRTSTFRRGRDRVKSILGKKKVPLAKEGDTEVDILVENQRGNYFLGKPYYSSQSLLNFDYSPWTTVDGKPSPVDVTNAQVPDPNWEWAWRTWYVDMSRDVDEQGWQYSFMFPSRFPWHGSHPFFLSFVRRRHWIRMRVRKNRHQPTGQDHQTINEAHKLNADYFTIHPSRTKSIDSNYSPNATSQPYSYEKRRLDHQADEDDGTDIDNMKTLFARLRSATVDRERISAVLTYMDQGGQDINYLADEIPRIMSLLVFEHSRRLLVAEMLSKVDAMVPPSEQEQKQQQQGGSTVNLTEAKKKDLLKAVHAADDAVKNLEYWSDIKYTVQQAETISGSDAARGWDPQEWQGLDMSGPAESKEDPAKPSEDEHKARDKGKGKGKGKAKAPTPAHSPTGSLSIGVPSSYRRALFPPAFSPTSPDEPTFSESRRASEGLD